jgi:poly(hydroxyalkanoate) granule-associated protein
MATKANHTSETGIQASEKSTGTAVETAETVEVKVTDMPNGTGQSSAWVIDSLRRMLLASIGAVAMTFDEAEGLVGRMVERGELAQKDGQKLLTQLRGRVNPRGVKAELDVEQRMEKVGERIEHGVEEVLSRLNIPSKRDIEDLSARIAQLSARIEELKKSK